jgi:hypothetical protein
VLRTRFSQVEGEGRRSIPDCRLDLVEPGCAGLQAAGAFVDPDGEAMSSGLLALFDALGEVNRRVAVDPGMREEKAGSRIRLR